MLSQLNQGRIIKAVRNCSLKKIKSFVLGGMRRQDSVYNGLKAVNKESDWVLIHDSARPFVDSKSITKVILAAQKSGAALLAVNRYSPVPSSVRSHRLLRGKPGHASDSSLDCCDLPFGGSQVTRILGCFANREAKTCWIVAPPRSWSWA